MMNGNWMNNFGKLRLARPALRSFQTLVLGAAVCVLMPAFLLAPLLASEAETGSGSHTLRFRNGDLLRGELKTIIPPETVLWQHPDAFEEIEFTSKNIEAIEFIGTQRPKSVPSSNLCRLQLDNNDQLQGDLVEFDGETLLLDTWYAGRLSIPASQLHWIRPVIPNRVIRYEGPTGLEGWTMGKMSEAVADRGEWRYRNGAFYAWKAASIARDLNLPEVASMQFDISWRGTLYLAIGLYTEYLHPVSLGATENEPEFGGFYSLQFHRFSADVLPVTRENPQRRLGPTAVQSLNQKTSAHIDVRVHKPKGLIALYVDGALVKQWIDSEEFVGTGTAVRFVHQGRGAIRLSNLRVSEWDGQIEEQEPDRALLGEDLTRLRNGDRVAGKIAGIVDGRMTINLGATNLDVPLDRIRQIDFSTKDPAIPAKKPVNVRGHFTWGGTLTFDLERWEQHEIAGVSPTLGPIKFDPLAFSRLELLQAE
jgi:hypothetical protein